MKLNISTSLLLWLDYLSNSNRNICISGPPPLGIQDPYRVISTTALILAIVAVVDKASTLGVKALFIRIMIYMILEGVTWSASWPENSRVADIEVYENIIWDYLI